jgi:hypothetical protein
MNDDINYTIFGQPVKRDFLIRENLVGQVLEINGMARHAGAPLTAVDQVFAERARNAAEQKAERELFEARERVADL